MIINYDNIVRYGLMIFVVYYVIKTEIELYQAKKMVKELTTKKTQKNF